MTSGIFDQIAELNQFDELYTYNLFQSWFIIAHAWEFVKGKMYIIRYSFLGVSCTIYIY